MAFNSTKYSVFDVVKLNANLRWDIIKRINAKDAPSALCKLIETDNFKEEIHKNLGYSTYINGSDIYRVIQVHDPLEDFKYIEHIMHYISKAKRVQKRDNRYRTRKHGVCLDCKGPTNDPRNARCMPCYRKRGKHGNQA